MKNILIIVPDLVLGGQQRVAVNLARILTPACNVQVAVFDRRNAVYSVDCELLDLNIPAAPGILRKVRNALRRAAALRKLRREKKIDYCISFGPTANLANVLSRSHGKTIVRTSSYADCADKAINRYIFRHCDRIICCSKVIRTTLLAAFRVSPEKAVTIYNPFDIDGIICKGEEEPQDYSFSAHTIATHGRLHKVKNYARLIKAFSLVRERVPDAQLLIIGEGEQRSELERLIEKYGMADSVTLLGFRSNPFAYLKRSCLYVLSSYHEGFPNALAEAMCFLPAVAADCKSGPREILSDGSVDTVCRDIEETDYGVLVRPADENEGWIEEISEDDQILADAILTLLRDPEKREELQRRAAERAREFSFERFREEVEHVLRRE